MQVYQLHYDLNTGKFYGEWPGRGLLVWIQTVRRAFVLLYSQLHNPTTDDEPRLNALRLIATQVMWKDPSQLIHYCLTLRQESEGSRVDFDEKKVFCKTRLALESEIQLYETKIMITYSATIFVLIGPVAPTDRAPFDFANLHVDHYLSEAGNGYYLVPYASYYWYLPLMQQYSITPVIYSPWRQFISLRPLFVIPLPMRVVDPACPKIADLLKVLTLKLK